MQASEGIARQFSTSLALNKIWGDVIVNVKAYGAKGNGNADDTAAIQAAIDYAVSIGKHDIYFPPGTYNYDVLTNAADITAYGDGVTLNGETVLNVVSYDSIVAQLADIATRANAHGAKGDGVTDDTDKIQSVIDDIADNAILDLLGKSYAITSTLNISNKKNLIIRNGKIINKTGGIALLLTACDYLHIDRIEVDNSNLSYAGVRIINSYNPLVTNSTFKNAAGTDCSLLRFISCPYLTVDNCKIASATATNTGAGIYLSEDAAYTNLCDNFTITNNVISDIFPDADGDGIKVQSAARYGLIQNNKLSNCRKRGVKLQQSGTAVSYEYVVVRDNFISGGAVYSAIDAQCGNALIENNKIVDCGGYGISLQGYNCKVTYNIIKSATAIVGAAGSAIQIADLGYAITSAKTIIIENNDISGTAYYGVIFRDTMLSVDLVAIRNNTFNNLLGRHTVFSVATCAIGELIISENIINISIGNYILMFGGTLTSLTVQTFIVKNNKMPTAQNITVLARADIELICANASLIDITLLNMGLPIVIAGGVGKTKYKYLSDTVPTSIPSTTYFYRYNLEKSKVGDYVERNVAVLNGTDKVNVGWMCIADADGTNVRGLWKQVSIDVF